MRPLGILGAAAARELATGLARHEGVAVAGRFGEPGEILDRFVAGEACDIVILTHSQVASLLSARRLAPDPCSDLGESPVAPGGAVAVHTVALPAAPAREEARAFALHLADRSTATARLACGFAGPSVRRATGADTAAARELVFSVLAEYGFPPDPQGTDADLADLEAGFLADGGMFDVAVDPDGRLAGCCGMKILADGRLELRKMYLRRDRRGLGLGRRLLDRALAWARARGHPRVELETATRLEDAIALYRKNGFVPRPGKPDTCRCDLAFVLELR